MSDIVISPLLGARSVSWKLQDNARGGGPSQTGSEQVVLSPTGRWTATVTFNVYTGLNDPRVLAYRSIIRRGRAGTLIVPEYDTRGPAQYAGLSIPRSGVPHSDGATFSDSTGYGRVIAAASFASSADLNATQVEIALATGLILLPGMRFSTPDCRMHEIDEILYVGGGVWGVRIAPWLLADYPAGTVLNFDRPVCRMKLASNDTGALSVAGRALSTPTIDLIQAI